MINPFQNLGIYGYGYGVPTFYGVKHLGIDRNTVFQDLPAPEKSKILDVSKGSAGGLMVTFQPIGRKLAIRWLHNSKIYVKKGDTVQEGQIICRSGNTGLVKPTPTPSNPTAGRHTHEDHWKNGKVTLKFEDTLNPDDYYQLNTNYMKLPIVKFADNPTYFLQAGISLFPFDSAEALVHAGGTFDDAVVIAANQKSKYDIRMESPITKHA